MRLVEIKKIAQAMGIHTFGKKKIELIRAIQKAENSIECFGTERMRDCQEKRCLWKKDCLALNDNRNVLLDVDMLLSSGNGSARTISLIDHIFLSTSRM